MALTKRDRELAGLAARSLHRKGWRFEVWWDWDRDVSVAGVVEYPSYGGSELTLNGETPLQGESTFICGDEWVEEAAKTLGLPVNQFNKLVVEELRSLCRAPMPEPITVEDYGEGEEE